MTIKAPIKVNNGGTYELLHPETEVAQITDIATYVDNKDAAILSSAKTDAKQYIKSVSTDGGILTITKGDGTTSSFTPILDNAEAHNSAPVRGKDLTSALDDGTLSTNIQNGTFKDIYIGDYFTKAYTANSVTYTVKWIIVHLDYFYHSGDSECTAHHIVVMPSNVPQASVSMNDTDTTDGGFIGSKMWTTTIPLHVTGIVNAFGDAHVLTHREQLSNAISTTAASAAGAGWTGSSTGWGWYDVRVNIPSEPMIYGGAVFGSSAYDVGNKNKQLAYFKGCPFYASRQWFWLQAVASRSSFCAVTLDGSANYFNASSSYSSGGFRPYFLYH